MIAWGGAGRPAHDRKEAELVGQADLQQDADPEPRQCDAGHRDQPAQIVQPRVLVHRGQDPEGHAEAHRQHERGGHQLDGRGQEVPDVEAHVPVGPDGLAEVPPEEPRHVVPELGGQGPVEPELLLVGRDLILRGLGAESQPDRVAGHHPRHDEDQDQEPEDGGEDLDQPAEEELAHGEAGAAPSRPRRDWRYFLSMVKS